MRILPLNFLIAALASVQLAQGQESRVTTAYDPAVHLELFTEDSRQIKIKLEIRTGGVPNKAVKKMEDLPPGSTELPLSGVADGKYFVYFSSPGYAPQWQTLTVKEGKGEPGTIKAKLFRKRYVVLRYEFNTSGGREFAQPSIQEGRAAVAHWASLPYFQGDWQIWQKSLGVDLFGDTPFLEFHRFSKDFGFAEVPKGVSFDDLKEIPTDAQFVCRDLKAVKGLTLFCRVQDNRKDGLGYGKLIVEDITETPPAGVKVIDTPSAYE